MFADSGASRAKVGKRRVPVRPAPKPQAVAVSRPSTPLGHALSGDSPATRTQDLRRAEAFKHTRRYYHAMRAAEKPAAKKQLADLISHQVHDPMREAQNKREQFLARREAHKESRRIAESIYRNEFARLFSRAQGYFGGDRPDVSFYPDQVHPGTLGWNTLGEDRIQISDSALARAMGRPGPSRSYASVQVPLHETVHTRQPLSLMLHAADREGGADLVSETIAHNLGYPAAGPRAGRAEYGSYDEDAMERVADEGWLAYLLRQLGRKA